MKLPTYVLYHADCKHSGAHGGARHVWASGEEGREGWGEKAVASQTEKTTGASPRDLTRGSRQGISLGDLAEGSHQGISPGDTWVLSLDTGDNASHTSAIVGGD